MEQEKVVVHHNNFKHLEYAVDTLLKQNFKSIYFKQRMTGGGLVYLVEQYCYSIQTTITLTVIIDPLTETTADVVVVGTDWNNNDDWRPMTGSGDSGMHKILYALSQEAASQNWQLVGIPERYLEEPITIIGSLLDFAAKFGGKDE